MHQYLKAIGMENINTLKKLKQLFWGDSPEEEGRISKIPDHEGTIFSKLIKECGQDMGIVLCGEHDPDNEYEMEFYYPYFEGSGITSEARVKLEQKYENRQYYGICDDQRLGFSLIFTALNGLDYVKSAGRDVFKEIARPVTLSGLALSGTILLPVRKEVKAAEKAADTKQRKNLISAARNGDPAAIETLTMNDMELYSRVSRRLINEDLFSIVDTYFMPHGVECDLYSILGEIIAVRERENVITGEIIYQMKLNVNEIQFDICVPKEQVLGEPEMGRRFRGDIWLQGQIHF